MVSPLYLEGVIPPYIFPCRHVRHQISSPAHPPSNGDRFHQQGKNLLRKEIRGKIGLIILAVFSIVQPTRLEWMLQSYPVCGFSSEAEDGLVWLGTKNRGRQAPCPWMKELEFHGRLWYRP
jgi:hypothetical protein